MTLFKKKRLRKKYWNKLIYLNIKKATQNMSGFFLESMLPKHGIQGN
jgi:hypothetical protein